MSSLAFRVEKIYDHMFTVVVGDIETNVTREIWNRAIGLGTWTVIPPDRAQRARIKIVCIDDTARLYTKLELARAIEKHLSEMRQTPNQS